jgi:hypothetical protein
MCVRTTNSNVASTNSDYKSCLGSDIFGWLVLPHRLHALMHLRDLARGHTGECIERSLVFLLAMPD